MTARSLADPRIERRALVPVLVLSFTQDALFALIFLSYMNHYLLTVLHAPAGAPGYTLSLYAAVNLLLLRPAGWAVDRFSARAVLRVSIGAQLGAVLLLLFFQSLPTFFAAVALFAAGAAGSWPVIYETVARTQPSAVVARATGAVVMVGYAAVAIGVIAGVSLGRFHAHGGAFALAGGLVAARIFVQGAAAFARPPGPEPEPVAVAAAPPVHENGASPRLLSAVVFLDFAAIAALAGIYGPFTRLSLGVGLFSTALLLAPAALAAGVSLVISSRRSQQGRRFQEMYVLYIVAALGAIALAVAPTPWAAALAAIPLAAGAGGTAPIVAAAVIDFSGGATRGQSISNFMSVEELGSVVGPGCAGLMADLVSPRGAMALIGLAFVALVALTSLASTRRVVRPLTES